MYNSESFPENETHKLLRDFDVQTDRLILARRPDHIIINNNNKKKRTCKIEDFAVPGDHRVKMKEKGKKGKYCDLDSELKKMWNLKVIIILIVIGALGTVPEWLLKGLEDLEETGQVEVI